MRAPSSKGTGVDGFPTNLMKPFLLALWPGACRFAERDGKTDYPETKGTPTYEGSVGDGMDSE
jgi:hypothetical protein